MHMNERKYFLLLAGLVLAFWSTSGLAAETKVKKNDRIIFLGDSITQAGDQAGGFVTLVREAVAKRHPDLKIEIIGAGIGGNKVGDLLARLDRDVIQKKPTKVIVYIGINDVWGLPAGGGTPNKEFGSGLRRVVNQIQATGAEGTAGIVGGDHHAQSKSVEDLKPVNVLAQEVAALGC